MGNFFGINDGWKDKKKIVFLDKQQVLDLFEKFEIIAFQEIEKDAKTGLGKIKHWHVFDIIAKKIKFS